METDRDDLLFSRNRKRRWFIATMASGAALVLAGCGKREGVDIGEEEVFPVEDLMREHGILRRVLLVYEEARRRIEADEDMPATALSDAAGVIRSFIEDYHEKLEEDHVFPLLRRANRLVDLVETLTEQHRAGRRLTEETLRLASVAAAKDSADRRVLADALRQFSRLYQPHAAREDTVLFPAFHELVGPTRYAELGDEFERREHKLFGADGFGKMVLRVAAVEKSLGIYDLGQFTPWR